MSDNPLPSAGEVRALAHQLMTWADQLSERPATGPSTVEIDDRDVMLGLAEAIRVTRRLRAEIFADVPLGNPAWDILLDLAIRELSGFRTSLDHLALDGEIPAPTVYESVETLVSGGLITRIPDRFDGRVTWLALSEVGKVGMAQLLQGLAALVRRHPGAAAA